jgi:hypothetical protein
MNGRCTPWSIEDMAKNEHMTPFSHLQNMQSVTGYRHHTHGQVPNTITKRCHTLLKHRHRLEETMNTLTSRQHGEASLDVRHESKVMYVLKQNMQHVQLD